MSSSLSHRESGLWKRGAAWLLLLGPLFFISYGLANSFTARREDVGTLVFAWETLTPLWPWSIVPYWSIDVLYGLSFLLCASRREVDNHALRLLSAQAICILGFLLFPLRFTFERPALEGVFGWLFDVLMGFDQPFNQAPSLHIALLVVLWACYARRIHGLMRWLLHGWFALIGISVLTTWQHHFIDVPSGALAGFLCLWLWPVQGPRPLAQLHRARTLRQWQLGGAYAAGTLFCTGLAAQFGGAWLWLLWPALALLLVALNYTLVGAAGFQKQAEGRLSPAAYVLLAPYLAGAWFNSRVWTARQPQPSEICEDVWLGRLPGPRELVTGRFSAVLDLCAELPLKQRGLVYRTVPVLDLTPPSLAQCQAAADAIEVLRGRGPLLVCCALGYSRSACAVAAWLLSTGRATDVDGAIAMIRSARPQVVLSTAHRAVLTQLSELGAAPANTSLEIVHAR